MPAEIAQVSFSESGCFHICAFSRCSPGTYCVLGLCRSCSGWHVSESWSLFPEEAGKRPCTRNPPFIYLFGHHPWPIFSLPAPMLGKLRWTKGQSSRVPWLADAVIQIPSLSIWPHNPVLTQVLHGQSRRQVVHQLLWCRGHFPEDHWEKKGWGDQ